MKIKVTNKKVVITDDCSGECKYTWTRITTFGLVQMKSPEQEDPKEEEKPAVLGMGARIGGACNSATSDEIEFCVFDKIDGSVEPKGVRKCTGKFFFFNIPKNDKVPSLTGKFICLARNYDT